MKKALLIAIIASISAFSQITNRIFTIGNSVTDGINFAGFQALANQKGNTHILARNMIPGAPLSFLYGATGGFETPPYGWWPTALGNYDWDCISFQPFDRDILGADGDYEIIKNYVNHLRGNRTSYDQLQIYIYSRYPRAPVGKTHQTATADDWNKLWEGTYGSGGQSSETKSYFERLVSTVRGGNLLPKAATMIPAGDVMYALNKKMVDGKIPGYTKIWDFYADGIHVNNLGSFTLGAIFFATTYKQDPRGLTVAPDYGSIPNALRDTILQTIYEVVFTHPLSGTSLLDIVPVTSITVSPKNYSLSFLQSFNLTANIAPLKAGNKGVSWKSSNTSVASIDQKGKVLGVGSGTSTLTATTNDGGFIDVTNVTVTGLANFTSITGVLASWNFAGKAGQNNVKATNFLNGVSSTTGLNAAIGIGLSPGAGLGVNGFTASDQDTRSLSASVAGNEHFSFSLAPKAGKLININSINVNVISQNVTRVFALYSSIKGFAVDNFIATFTGNGIISIPNHKNISQLVDLKINVYYPGPDPFDGTYLTAGIGNTFSINGDIVTLIDNTSPTSVSGILVSQIKDNGFFLSWNEATDNMIVWGYNVYNNGIKLNTELLTETTYQLTGLPLGSSNAILVRAVDFVGNESAPSAITVITNRKPTAVLNANVLIGAIPLTVNFSSTGSSDPDTGSGDFVLGFDWNFGNGNTASSNSSTQIYTVAGVYTVSLRVVDNRELRSDFVFANVTVISELIAPTPPTVITTLSRKSTALVVSFAGATDNIGVSGYLLSVNGVAFGADQVSGNTRTITGLAAGTIYQIGVRAADASGNFSIPVVFTAQTNFNPVASISVTPLVSNRPSTLTLSGINSSDPDGDIVSFEWTVAGKAFSAAQFTSKITVAGVYMATAKVSDTNGGSSLAMASFTILSDIIAPTAPTAVKVTKRTNTAIVLSITGATDNLGLKGSLISVNGVAFNPSPIAQTVITITGLTVNTVYDILVASADLDNNVSAPFALTAQTNFVPVASIVFKASSNQLPISVTFSGLNSVDSDGDLMKYNWTFQSKTYTTAEFKFNFTTLGSFAVSLQVTDPNGGVSVKDTTIDIGAISSNYAGSARVEKLNVYPNPVTGTLYLDRESAVTITDITGCVMYNTNTAIHQLDVSFLPSGIYILIANGKEYIKLIKE